MPNSTSFFYFQHNSIERFQSKHSFCASSCLEQKHLSNFQWNLKQITVSQKHASCAKPQPAIPSSFVFDFFGTSTCICNMSQYIFRYFFIFTCLHNGNILFLSSSDAVLYCIFFLCTHLCFFSRSLLVFESINRFVHLIICKWQRN